MIGKKPKDKVKDQVDRVLIEGQESGTLDLSTQASNLKDIYVLDKVNVILPTCNSDMDGKVINFYKWGGTPDAGSTYSFTGKTSSPSQWLGGANGGIFNYANVADYVNPDGITSSRNKITIDGRNNTRFKLLKFVCIASYRGNFAWFLDFSSFTNKTN